MAAIWARVAPPCGSRMTAPFPSVVPLMIPFITIQLIASAAQSLTLPASGKSSLKLHRPWKPWPLYWA